MSSEQRHIAQIRYLQKARTEAVIDIVVVVGDFVGQVRDLGFEAWLVPLEEALAEVAEGTRIRQGAVLEDSLPALERQVQSGKFRVTVLELVHDTQRLHVVLEPAELAQVRRSVRPALLSRGGRLLWGEFTHVRDLTFTDLRPVRYPVMMSHLWQGVP